MFGGVDGLAPFSAVAKFTRPLLDICVELVDVVEGRDHNVSALPAIRVVAVMPHDPALDAVVIGINRRHRLEHNDLAERDRDASSAGPGVVLRPAESLGGRRGFVGDAKPEVLDVVHGLVEEHRDVVVVERVDHAAAVSGAGDQSHCAQKA